MAHQKPTTKLALGAALLMAATSARCDITYVDAQEGASGNTYASGGSLADTSWIDTTSNSAASNDNDWILRSGGSPGFSQHNGGDVIQGNSAVFPNALGEIVTEVPGLPDGNYDVWVFFWEQITSSTQNWVIDAGLVSGSLTAYSTPAGPVLGTNSTSAVNAATLTFANSPAVVGANSQQHMYGVKLGQVAVSGGKSISVYVNKLSGSGSDRRTIYDGIGYEFTGPLVPPALVSTAPADNATDVPTGRNLSAVFDIPVQPGASGNITLKRSADGSTVEILATSDTSAPGTVTFSGNTVTIDPSDDLVGGTEYYLLIDPGAIESTAGVAFPGIATAGAWSFRADGTAPEPAALGPMAGAIGAQPGADLSLAFGEEVLAVAGTFIRVHRADGTLIETIDVSSAVIAGGQVTIPVSVALALGTSYYVTIDPGAFTDLSGNAFGGVTGTSAWTFTTALSDITYVDAVEGASGNTFATAGSPGDTSWQDALGGETLWRKRIGSLETTPLTGFNGDTAFEALHNVGDGDSVPELTTRITGLADGTYSIWVFYWDQITSNAQNWTISAGLSSGNLASFSSPGQPAVAGATMSGVASAANLSFTTPVTFEGANGVDPAILRRLYGVEAGRVTVSGGAGTVEVYVNNLIGNGSANRTWYDGVGYQLIAPPSAETRITSFTAVGGGVWELTLEGEADTKYEFRSSTTLDFTPGTLVQNLTQGNPGTDPGTIGGPGNSVVTTNGVGLAVVRLVLSGSPSDFVRARSLP